MTKISILLAKISFDKLLVFLVTKKPPNEGVLEQKVLGYKKKDFKVLFEKILHIQIQIYPQTYIEPNYCAFYLKNKVSVHWLVLLVQLSWRVAPPFKWFYFTTFVHFLSWSLLVFSRVADVAPMGAVGRNRLKNKHRHITDVHVRIFLRSYYETS